MRLDLARRLAPILLCDEREPFLPRWAGVSLIASAAPSPSFRRELSPPPGGLVLEYAIYWDWDIQHLYDLEHVWIFLGPGEEIVDVEASFHGKYRKALAPARENLVGGRPRLYCQPGKHAFAPRPEDFREWPGWRDACGDAAGAAGAEVPWPLRGRVARDPAWDGPVRRYLQGKRFAPSWSFRPWEFPDGAIAPWEELDARLPGLFRDCLAEAGASSSASGAEAPAAAAGDWAARVSNEFSPGGGMI